MSKLSKSPSGSQKKKRKRLAPPDRDAQIVKETIRYFAEVGIGGQTRELAQRLGITQPLLYRYFPTKQHLIERVYEEVFEKHWSADWRLGLQDKSMSLRDRLIEFYKNYTKIIFNYEWMRIYMYSGLAGAELNKQYISRLENEILKTICFELRDEFGHKKVNDPITDMELELVWNLQGGIFYYGVRKYIYQIKVSDDLDTIISECIDSMLEGAPRTLDSLEG